MPSNIPTVHSPAVEHQLHQLLLQQLPRLLLANCIVAVVVAITFGSLIGWTRPMIFLAGIWIISGVRFWATKKGYSSAFAQMLGAGATGIAWGLLSHIGAGPLPEPLRLFCAVIVCAMMASALLSLGANLKVYWCFCAPFMLGAALAQLDGSVVGYGTFAAAVAYTLTMVFYGPVVHATLRRSIELGIANQGLIEDLVQQRNIATAQREARTRFLAVASHDLRQPAHAIGLITSYLEALLARKEPSGSPPWQQGIGRLKAGVESMNALLDDLLDLTRLQLQSQAVPLVSVDLQPVLARLIARYQPLAERAGLALRWRSTASIRVVSNAAMLERVLGNLLSNAIRYTARGGVLLAVRRRPEHVLICVYDTGRGIPESERKRIFDEFVRLEGVAIDNPDAERLDRDRGIGLGLAIVAQSAQLLGHPLSLRSRVGKGSCFALRLARATMPHFPLAMNAENIAPANSELGLGRALVLDDDPLVCDVMAALLQDRGWAVSVHHELDTALEVAFQFAPSILLIDVHLIGGQGGETALLALRHELDAAIPALIMSGDQLETLQHLVDARTRLLRKPLAPEVFWAELTRVSAINRPA
jgi:signal transduction histidine kinase/CheY-like chemotaxis protein